MAAPMPAPPPAKQRRQSATAAAQVEAALRARLAAVARLRAGLAEPTSVMSQSLAAYQELLDDVLLDIVIEVQRGIRSGQDDLSDLAQEAEPMGVFTGPASTSANPRRSQPDAFGQTVPTVATAPIVCTNCGKRMAAGRFAPHLEKCLGVGDRAAGRPSRTARAPARD